MLENSLIILMDPFLSNKLILRFFLCYIFFAKILTLFMPCSLTSVTLFMPCSLTYSSPLFSTLLGKSLFSILLRSPSNDLSSSSVWDIFPCCCYFFFFSFSFTLCVGFCTLHVQSWQTVSSSVQMKFPVVSQTFAVDPHSWGCGKISQCSKEENIGQHIDAG